MFYDCIQIFEINLHFVTFKQVLRAANMTVAAMRFIKTMRAGQLEPEIFHLNPEKSDTKRFRQIARYYSLLWLQTFSVECFAFFIISIVLIISAVLKNNIIEVFQQRKLEEGAGVGLGQGGGLPQPFPLFSDFHYLVQNVVRIIT